MAKLYNVSSSHGSLGVDESGAILEVEEYPESEGDLQWYQDNAERFDVEEFKLFWDEKDPDSIDILNLGLHMKDGTFEGPCKNHRRELLFMRMDAGAPMSELTLDFFRWYGKLTSEEMNDDVVSVYPTREKVKELSNEFKVDHYD